MIIQITLKDRLKARTNTLEIWGIDAGEVSRILNFGEDIDKRKKVLEAFISHEIRNRMPMGYDHWDVIAWEFSLHSPQAHASKDIKDEFSSKIGQSSPPSKPKESGKHQATIDQLRHQARAAQVRVNNQNPSFRSVASS